MRWEIILGINPSGLLPCIAYWVVVFLFTVRLEASVNLWKYSFLKIICSYSSKKEERPGKSYEQKKMIPILTAQQDLQKGRTKPQVRETRGSTLVTLVGKEQKKEENSANPIPTVSSYQDLPSKGVVKVNQTSLLTLMQIRDVAQSSHFWHKFLIYRGAGYCKKDILRALTAAVSPFLVVPVQFKQEGSAVSFLSRNCFPLIEKLIIKKLKIQVSCIGPSGPDLQELHVEVVLRYAHVSELAINPLDVIQIAVFRRHDRSMRSLDLSGFMDDAELASTVLWPLCSSTALANILNMLHSHHMAIRMVNLANNDLNALKPLNVLPNLRVLDVSGNNLQALSVLHPLKSIPISDLSLDRNPLCTTYKNEREYISDVRSVAPYVKKLDGVFIPHRPDLPCWWANYVPREHSVDCTALVDQFLQHFFTLLDGDDRLRLKGMYHTDALFSLTCLDGLSQSAPSSAGMLLYSSESRNLLRISDYSKIQQLLSQGAEDVLSTLCRLPETEHDPYSFAVDVPFFNHDAAMIVVQGVFREPSKPRDVRAFSRLFLLKRVAANEYQITNEMLTVSRATPRQLSEAFLHPKPKVSLAKLSFNPAQDLTDADQAQMTRILSRITEMNQRWARKCLEESKWDIKNTLQVFTELLKMNKLPAEAFFSEEDRT